jgi:hypothetical protein
MSSAMSSAMSSSAPASKVLLLQMIVPFMEKIKQYKTFSKEKLLLIINKLLKVYSSISYTNLNDIGKLFEITRAIYAANTSKKPILAICSGLGLFETLVMLAAQYFGTPIQIIKTDANVGKNAASVTEGYLKSIGIFVMSYQEAIPKFKNVQCVLACMPDPSEGLIPQLCYEFGLNLILVGESPAIGAESCNILDSGQWAFLKGRYNLTYVSPIIKEHIYKENRLRIYSVSGDSIADKPLSLACYIRSLKHIDPSLSPIINKDQAERLVLYFKKTVLLKNIDTWKSTEIEGDEMEDMYQGIKAKILKVVPELLEVVPDAAKEELAKLSLEASRFISNVSSNFKSFRGPILEGIPDKSEIIDHAISFLGKIITEILSRMFSFAVIKFM